MFAASFAKEADNVKIAKFLLLSQQPPLQPFALLPVDLSKLLNCNPILSISENMHDLNKLFN